MSFTAETCGFDEFEMGRMSGMYIFLVRVQSSGCVCLEGAGLKVDTSKLQTACATK